MEQNNFDNQETQQSAKEQYEMRKREKEKQKHAQRENSKKQQAHTGAWKQRIIWTAIVLAIVGGVAWLVSTFIPETQDQSISYDIQGRQHIAEGTTHEQYNSNPPSSGPHWPSPAHTGIYSEPIADEQVIHNLEHGDIWIAYHPRIGEQAQVFAEEFDEVGVIVTPRETNDTDIALVAWGRVDAFNIEGDIPTQRIRDFIIRYKNKGPEQVPSVGHR